MNFTHPPKLRKKAIELRRKEKISYSEIARLLKIKVSTVGHWLRMSALLDKELSKIRCAPGRRRKIQEK